MERELYIQAEVSFGVKVGLIAMRGLFPFCLIL